MKDSQGRYWCVACGSADLERQRRAVRAPCCACGKVLSSDALFHVRDRSFCIECLPSRPAHSHGEIAIRSPAWLTRSLSGRLGALAPLINPPIRLYLTGGIVFLFTVIVLEIIWF